MIKIFTITLIVLCVSISPSIAQESYKSVENLQLIEGFLNDSKANPKQIVEEYNNNTLSKDLKLQIYANKIEEMDYKSLPVDVKALMIYLVDTKKEDTNNPTYKLTGKQIPDIAGKSLIELLPQLASGGKLSFEEQLILVREKINELKNQGISFDKYVELFNTIK